MECKQKYDLKLNRMEYENNEDGIKWDTIIIQFSFFIHFSQFSIVLRILPKHLYGDQPRQ